MAIRPTNVPRLADTALDGRVRAPNLLLSLVTAAIFGLALALQGSSSEPADPLRAGRTSSAGRARQRSASRLTAVDPGFEAGGQLTFGVVLVRSMQSLFQVKPPDVTTLVAVSAVGPGRRYRQLPAGAPCAADRAVDRTAVRVEKSRYFNLTVASNCRKSE